MVTKKPQYSLKIGIVKSLKNTLIIVGIPALVLFIDNWATILPDEWNAYTAPIMGIVAYLVKNYVSNR